MPKQRTVLILAVLLAAVIAVSYFAYLPSSAPLAAQVSLASDYIKPNPANTLAASAANFPLPNQLRIATGDGGMPNNTSCGVR